MTAPTPSPVTDEMVAKATKAVATCIASNDVMGYTNAADIIARACLTAALAVDGVALVPREPTEDMLDFGACYEDPDGLYQNHSIFKDGDISRDVYRAMIEAASREFPQPPAASDWEERK